MGDIADEGMREMELEDDREEVDNESFDEDAFVDLCEALEDSQ